MNTMKKKTDEYFREYTDGKALHIDRRMKYTCSEFTGVLKDAVVLFSCAPASSFVCLEKHNNELHMLFVTRGGII